MAKLGIGLVTALGVAGSLTGCAQSAPTTTTAALNTGQPSSVSLPGVLRPDQVVQINPDNIRELVEGSGDRQVQIRGGGRGGGSFGGGRSFGGRGFGGRGFGGRGWGGRGWGGRGWGGYGWGGYGWGGYGWPWWGYDSLAYYPYGGSYYPYYGYGGSYYPYYYYNSALYYQPYLNYTGSYYTPYLGNATTTVPYGQYAMPYSSPGGQQQAQVASVSVVINMPPRMSGMGHGH